MQLDRKEIFKALRNSETYATVLHAITLATFEEEFYSWDSLEIYARLEEEYSASLHEDNENKLMAMITAVSTPFFYRDLEVFNAVATSLTSGDPGLADVGFDTSTILDIFWAVYEVGLNVEEIDFSESIKNFINENIEDEAVETDTDQKEVTDKYTKAVKEMSVELHSQLNKVGFNEVPEMPEIK